MTYAVGEQWCWNGIGTSCGSVSGYDVVWGKEFRYDGARQRYVSIDLDAALLKQSGIISPLSERWTHYDGNQPTGDATERDTQLGIGRVEPPTTTGGANTMYYHTDHLGTTRLMSDASGYAATGWYDSSATDVTPSVFTAFGEPITGPLDGGANRYGYVGAYGYQAHNQSQMHYLHVGHRYYDPSLGRFLQRDPIGIAGGFQVFSYVGGTPSSRIDPLGLYYPTDTTPGGGWQPPPPPGTGHKLKGGKWVPKTPNAPKVPWYKTPFNPRNPGHIALCFVAAKVGWETGKALDRRWKSKTGRSLSERIGQWAGNACTWCFNW